MDIYQAEDTDGVRLPWNVLPMNRNWADRIVLPVGVLYTPAKQIADLDYLGDAPVICISCRTVLNPFCQVDTNTKSFLCPICNARSAMPQSKMKYLAEHQGLPEISANSTTIEYQLDAQIRDRGFLFVIDKCVPPDEMVEIKNSVKTAVQGLLDDTYVGLITYDRNVFIQDLEETQFLSEFAFNGNKDYQLEAIGGMLNFGLPAKDAVNHQPSPNHKRIFAKLEHCRDIFERAIDKINTDKWVIGANDRPARASGAALKIAMAVSSGWYQHVGDFYKGNPNNLYTWWSMYLRTRSNHSTNQRNLL